MDYLLSREFDEHESARTHVSRSVAVVFRSLKHDISLRRCNSKLKTDGKLHN